MAKIKALYAAAKAAKVGETCTCPSCDSIFVKTNYQQAFCKTKGNTVCKDRYWNIVTPTKRNNTTRISPANAAWYTRMLTAGYAKTTSEGYEIINGTAYDEWGNPIYDVDRNEDDHIFSSEALGQD